MLDIKFIREHPEKVKAGAAAKNINIDIEEILRLDSKYRELSQALQELYTQRNRAAKERDVEGGREIKAEVGSQEGKLKEIEERLDKLLASVPNLPAEDVKIGKDESQNEVIRKHGAPKKFDFRPRDHVELGEILDVIDIERAAKVSGTRFAYLKNEGVLLEFALVQFAFDTLTREGFTPIIPPVLIRQKVARGLGYLEAGGNDDYYLVFDPKDDPREFEEDKRELDEYPGYYLAGTAEHAIVPMHMDEIFLERDLPKRYVGFSTSFRREAGSYGKDTRGILRVHQFDKVEMVSFATAENNDSEHEYLLSLEEKFFQALKIPYQVVKMCTGDLGFPTARKYDIEAWIPTQDKYREVTSVSTTTDFQARRLNIRFQEDAVKKFVHILNGTAFAIGRTLIAILENYQEQDGTVVVPEVLRNYINLDKISPKNK